MTIRKRRRLAGRFEPADDRDSQTLHRLLDLIRRDEGALLVVDVIWLAVRHRVVARLSDGADFIAPYEPVLIRCGPRARPIQSGMRLRLWRDAAGVHLEHCIP